MPLALKTILVCFLLMSFASGAEINAPLPVAPLRLTPHRITLDNGRSFTLNLLDEFEITPAVQGLKRVRFMAKSPDDRIFVTDMYDLTDNRKGVVYILDEFDPEAKRFKKVTKFMSGLRNPNSVAFYTANDGTQWFYLALTDRLVRYRYENGSTKPTGESQVLATFPDYGLSYKYGGWHLTRTIAVGPNNKIYVSVGSSCNACEEKEDVRASVLEMDPDGKNKRHFAHGLRNAVGLRWVDGQLFVTNMGADHLGLDKPDDTMGTIKDNTNYGWPYCFQSGTRVFVDQKYNPGSSKFDCKQSPPLAVGLGGHTAPLGLEYFDASNGQELSRAFLVALHGSTNKRIARGYKVVRLATRTSKPEDFITGFLVNGVVNGRRTRVFVDQKYNPGSSKFDCKQSPPLAVGLGGHTAPLGLEYFDASNGQELSRAFLVALHGSTNKRIARGYKVVRLATRTSKPEDFITGFLVNGVVNGRPCDIFGFGRNSFLLTDDKAGVVYYVYKKA